MKGRRRPTSISNPQLALELPEKLGWGGARKNAGRKARTSGVAHVKRPVHRKSHPVHVTMRLKAGLPNLRSQQAFAVVKEALRRSKKDDFRIVEFSVMSNHLHLIVEAEDERALARGMRGLAVRIACGINKRFNRKGAVFSDRYHRVDLKSPKQTRSALAYVLQNFRKHGRERGERYAAAWVDPRSSSSWFVGWDPRRRRVAPLPRDEHAPVASPETWLLREGWSEKWPWISPDEVPGLRAIAAAKKRAARR